MIMQPLTIYRETALPSDLKTNAVYLIAPSNTTDYVEIYVVGNTLENTRRSITSKDVENQIIQALKNHNQLTVVNNIDERNLIENPNGEVFVLDATGDNTVSSGGARYLYNNGQWLKIAETESMDLSFAWNALIGKPESTPQQIDNAVNLSHNHANASELNKIGQDEKGNLTYDNKPVMRWATTGW